MDRRLPYEILLAVCSLVDQDDLLSLRLSSKTLATVGLEVLPTQYRFFFRKSSLQRLQHIADHPVMHLRLTSVTFIADMVPNFQDAELWESQALAVWHSMSSAEDTLREDWFQETPQESWFRLHDKSVAMPIKDLDHRFGDLGWQYQQRLRYEQEELLRDIHNVSAIVKQSLAKLPNLTEFCLDTLNDNHRKTLRPLFMVEPNQSWYCFNSTCSLESFETISPYIFNAFLDSLSLRLGMGSSASLLRSLYIGATDFVNFTKASLPSLWLQPAFLQNITTIQLYSCKLGRLDSVSHDHKQISFQKEESASFFLQLLANLPNLQHLDLFVRAEPRFHIGTIFESCIWPHISFLDLANVAIGNQTLRAFLSEHSGSITFIRLMDAHIEVNNRQEEHVWIELFKFMKNALSLEKIELMGDLTERHDTKFNRRAVIDLDSKTSIIIEDVVRYLLCELKPHSLDEGEVVDEDEIEDEVLRSLTWADLLHAYD